MVELDAATPVVPDEHHVFELQGLDEGIEVLPRVWADDRRSRLILCVELAEQTVR